MTIDFRVAQQAEAANYRLLGQQAEAARGNTPEGNQSGWYAQLDQATMKQTAS
jgi:hypothetical protein